MNRNKRRLKTCYVPDIDIKIPFIESIRWRMGILDDQQPLNKYQIGIVNGDITSEAMTFRSFTGLCADRVVMLEDTKERIIREYVCNETYYNCRVSVIPGDELDLWILHAWKDGGAPIRRFAIRKMHNNHPARLEMENAWITKSRYGR
jgi:hypothetical protein